MFEVTRRLAAGETLEQIAMPPLREQQKGAGVRPESLLDVYKAAAEKIRAEQR